jgi:hypothetical protein
MGNPKTLWKKKWETLKSSGRKGNPKKALEEDMENPKKL